MYEQPLVDRRRLLVWALQVGVGTLALPGCGGSGDSGADDIPAEPVPNNGIVLTTAAVSGSVQMPAAATAMPVTAGNLFSQEPVNSALGFALTLIKGSRILTTANGAAGGALLVGLLAEGRTVLSPETTAVVVAFMALGAPMQVEAVQSLILEELEKPGVLAGLSAAISAAIVARGEKWLDFNDAALRQALGSVLSALSPAAALREKPLGAIVDPTTRLSGLQVNADGAGSAVIANYFRRRVYAYVDRVSYTDKQGRTTSSKGVVGTQPIKLGAVKGLNTALLTLVDVAAGNKDHYDPVYSDAFDVPVFGEGAVSTEYSITTVGLAGTKFGDFGSLTQKQQEGWKEVALQSLVLDIVVPAITNIVLPIAGESIDNWVHFFGGSAVAKDFIAALALREEIITKIRDGNVSEAIADTCIFFVNLDTLRNAFLELFLNWVDSGFPGSPKIDKKIRIRFARDFTLVLLKGLSDADIAVQAFDTAVALTDLSRAQPASIFTLEVTNAIAALNPRTAQTDSIGVPIVFTAAVTNADLSADTVLSYTWETTGQFGDISDGLPEHTGKAFESSRAVLSYVPNGKGKPGDTDTVKVKVYKGGINGRIPIGEAVSTVSYKKPYSLSISPAGTSASPTEVPTETNFGITAFFNEVLPAGTTVAWQWSHSGVGSVSGSPADSNPTDSDVTFSSGLGEGASTVTARATVKVPATAKAPALSFDTEPISTALNVKKGLREIKMQVFGGAFDCFVAAACGVNNYTAFVVPKFAKAIQYKAVLTELGVGHPYYDSIGNTQTRYWSGPVGDGGGINFPITDYPHGVLNTKAWAVWISFGGPINGKCMVTITLQP